MREKPVDISVVIPTHRRHLFLREALQSVFRQKGVSFEAIVVNGIEDDADTDGVVAEFAGVNYIRAKEYLSCSSKRALALSIARGRYMHFLDDDDYIVDDGFFSKAVVLLDANEDIAFFAGSIRHRYEVAGGGEPTYEDAVLSLAGRIDGLEYFRRLQLQWRKPHAGATVFRKAALVCDNALQEVNDASIFLQSLMHGDAYLIKDIVAVYRKWGGSISYGGEGNDLRLKMDTVIQKERFYRLAACRIADADKWWRETFKMNLCYFKRSTPDVMELAVFVAWGVLHSHGDVNLVSNCVSELASTFPESFANLRSSADSPTLLQHLRAMLYKAFHGISSKYEPYWSRLTAELDAEIERNRDAIGTARDEQAWNHPALSMAEDWRRYAGKDDYGPTEIKLYYYNDWPNFGDSLSQKLVAALSGATVTHAPSADAEMMGAGSLFDIGDVFFGSEEKPMEKGKPILRVWGAGFLHPEIPEGPIFRYRDMIVHAVRGRKTLEALRRVGYVAEGETPALGDPGLLYADLFPESRTAEKKYDIALIPHRYDQVAALNLAEVLRAQGYSVVYVDVMLSEPRDIILQIAESRKVLSSSLHGIIVADSLGVPNRRLVFDASASCPWCQISISHFKFADYYSAFDLDAPAYETEAHVLADPKAAVEAVTAADCVPKAKVEACKAGLLAAFPIPENARRKAVAPVEETPVPKARRMKVLMVCEPDSLNPFPQHIYNEILEYDLDADCSAETFWTCDVADYDIVHIQFPEAFFNWQVDAVKPEQMKRLADRLEAFRAAGCKIVYTRHNQTVHIPRKGCIDKVYRMLDAESDGILHMGRYSIMDCKGKNPNSKARHYLVPHHTYPHLLRKVDRTTCCRRLGLNPDNPVVLSFGSFRNDKERALVRNAVAECGVDGVQLLAPALAKVGFVSARDLPLYFGAADVVFIQRVRIFNSGNLPLGFYYGKVVVGPNLCDVGEWLRATGNPVFEVFRPGSEAVALARGLALARQGLGEKNRAFADREWSIEAVGAKVVAAYADLTGRPVPARSGNMQFKRIDIGVATEYLHARNREHRQNLDKADEIKRLREETLPSLNAKVARRDEWLAALRAKVARRDKWLAELKAKVERRDELIASLKAKVERRDKWLAAEKAKTARAEAKLAEALKVRTQLGQSMI